MERVPDLHPKPPGIGLRALSIVAPGVRRVSAQIKPYTRWWSAQNQVALAADGPLLVVIGDSTAVGIGASAPDRGYVGLLLRALNRRDGLGRELTPDLLQDLPPDETSDLSATNGAGPGEPAFDPAVIPQHRDGSWRVINLAQSGARVADGLERQLDIVDRLRATEHATPSLTVSLIGSNDVVWSKDTTVLRDRLRTLIGRLPEDSLVGLVAGGSPRARLANRAIKGSAGEHGHRLINPWAEPGPPAQARLAEDRFHPNDLGYVLMTRPFARAVNAPEPVQDSADR